MSKDLPRICLAALIFWEEGFIFACLVYIHKLQVCKCMYMLTDSLSPPLALLVMAAAYMDNWNVNTLEMCMWFIQLEWLQSCTLQEGTTDGAWWGPTSGQTDYCWISGISSFTLSATAGISVYHNTVVSSPLLSHSDRIIPLVDRTTNSTFRKARFLVCLGLFFFSRKGGTRFFHDSYTAESQFSPNGERTCFTTAS